MTTYGKMCGDRRVIKVLNFCMQLKLNYQLKMVGYNCRIFYASLELTTKKKNYSRYKKDKEKKSKQITTIKILNSKGR